MGANTAAGGDFSVASTEMSDVFKKISDVFSECSVILVHKWERTGIVADVDDTIEARVSYDGHVVLHTDAAKKFDRAFILDEKVRDAA